MSPYPIQFISVGQLRVELAIAQDEVTALRKDKARLDWLLKRGIPQEPGERHSATWTREAVDKAMEVR